MRFDSKYGIISNWLRERIEKRELLPGQKIESENEIRKIFQVSRQTVRQAMTILEAEGLIERRQGKGSFVKGPEEPGVGVPATELSHTVTIISTYIDGYIFPRILKAMIKELEKDGYDTKLFYTENHRKQERAILKKILEEDIRDPLIIEPVMSGIPNPNIVYYRKIREKGIPVLFFNSYYPEIPELPHISPDDEKAGYLVTRYLIEQGHTKIGGIFKSDDGQGRRRYKGAIEAMLENDIEMDEARVCWIDSEEMKDPEILKLRILKRIRKCTGVVCYNDEVAHILTQLCEEHQIRIPEDLSIVSVDNSELASLNTIPLTSISHPMEQLGIRAAQNMMKLIENPQYPATYEFVPELHVRGSVRTMN